MDWGLQALVQVFLVVGGAGYVGWGAFNGDFVQVAIGVFALAVGVTGLRRDGRLPTLNGD